MPDHGARDSTLVFFVNGKKVVDSHVDPEWTLLYYLRNKLHLCGTKLGCAEGGCGACTVMVSKYYRNKKKIIHLPVNACLAPVCSMHGLAVTTVEGIGSTKTRLHPVQERIAKAHGSQCGFCTPGFVMSMYALLRSMPKPSMKDLEVAFQGNLCRCTGYRPIIEGYRTFTEEWEKSQIMNGVSNGNGVCALGDKCCKNSINGYSDREELFNRSEFTPYDPGQEPIFPPELKLSDVYDNQSLVVEGPNVVWYRPTQLFELLDLKHKYPNAKIITGNTEVGVEVKFKHFSYPVLVSPTHVSEMNCVSDSDGGVRIGASVTLQEVQSVLRERIARLPEYKTRIFAAVVDMLHYFAGKQVRSVAAIGGNIMTGSPISDLNPILLAANVELELGNKERGRRTVRMDDKFFTGYRRSVVQNDEVLLAVNIPYTSQRQYFQAYKQARRRDDDIAIVNIAFNVILNENNTIKHIAVAFGGMAPTTMLATKTANSLIGKVWNDSTLELAYDNLVRELPLSPSAPGGMIKYRRALTLSLFYKSYLAISQQLKQEIPKTYASGSKTFKFHEPKSSQYFQIVPDSQNDNDPVGRPVVHMSAFKQATGEAVYCDDIPKIHNELYMGLVLTTRPYANLLSIDPSEALATPGVHAFVSAKDLPGHRNHIGAVFHDDEVFVSKTVLSQGQVVGAVVADDQYIAQSAARKVKVVYEDLKPVIVTIEDAIREKSFYETGFRRMQRGDVDEAFKSCDHLIESDCRMGGQEHFYLETQCVIAIPKGEDSEMEIISSTQHPSEVSKLVAHALGIPINRVVTKAKRLGGGFGGKESRAANLAVQAAVCAHKVNVPVRCMLDRDEDMMTTGTRHPFLFKYKTGFNKDGKIVACEIHIYNNAGYSTDLSLAVLERAVFHFENAYYIPNVNVYGYVCKTNLPSNTAFRGFGGPQGMFAAENMIRDVAEYLKKDVAEVARLNLYKENDSTPYNQKLTYCTLERCWDEVIHKSDFQRRKREIGVFNKENRWRKRGMALVPTKFGIAFTYLTLNQSGALLHVYTDGSVLLSHGGIEMGQGLHTKMIQVASRALGIPHTKIHISETATDKVPNTSPTAASAGSDLNGMAVLNACEKIMERLQPIIKQNPNGTWEEWAAQAYQNRVSLSATGFYATPGIGYNWDTNSGNPFNYFTYGVACTEVEIDCLTGDHQVLRTDIVMDLGESLNPAIDIGQVEGGFMQGYGLFVLEEMVYSPQGTVYSRGPGAYKLPGYADIPVEFNVSLLKGAPNPRAVYSSKAVGEPPLFLASSALFAIREAVKAAREDAGVEPYFRLNAPATSARIRTACEDHLLSKLEEPKPGTYVPWNVVP